MCPRPHSWLATGQKPKAGFSDSKTVHFLFKHSTVHSACLVPPGGLMERFGATEKSTPHLTRVFEAANRS